MDADALTAHMLAELGRRYPHDDAVLAQRLARRGARGSPAASTGALGGVFAPQSTREGPTHNVLVVLLQAILHAVGQMSQQQVRKSALQHAYTHGHVPQAQTVARVCIYMAVAAAAVACLAPGLMSAVFVSAVSTTVNLSIRGLLGGLVMAALLGIGLRGGGQGRAVRGGHRATRRRL